MSLTASYLRDHHISYEYNDAPVFNESDRTFNLATQYERDRSRSAQLFGLLEIHSKPSEKLTFRWGVEATHDDVFSQRAIFARNALGEQFFVEPRLSRYPNGALMRSETAFLTARYLWSETVTFDAGIRSGRYHIDMPFEGVEDLLGRGLNPYYFETGATSGFAAIHVKLPEQWRLSARTSTGYRSPNVADLSGLGPQRDRTYIKPASGLGAEQTWNNELEISKRTEKFSLSATGFFQRYFNMLRADATGRVVDYKGDVIPGQTAPIVGQFREYELGNHGSGYLGGVEFAADLHLHSRVQSGLRFTWYGGRQKEADGDIDPIERVPPAFGRAFIRYTYSKQLALLPEIRFNGPKATMGDREFTDPQINPLGTEGFIVTHLAVIWTPKRGPAVVCRVENLFNQVYRDYGSTFDGLQRNVTLTARYTF
jgi:outer membrane receptor protein involved in Fe transport